jgi:endonuclease/exonuclease/phosphatase (EEP) superfamily protein YafD
VPAVNAGNVQVALDCLGGLNAPQLLVGDFNAVPESGGMQRLAHDGWKDAWARLRPEDGGFTYEANAPAQRIDYVWADPAAAARLRAIDSFGEGEAWLSDHLGLVVTLA